MELETCDEVLKLRIEFQKMIQLRQASSMDATSNMMAELTRDSGRYGPRGTEGGIAMEESPAGAVPTAIRETPAEAGLARDTTTVVYTRCHATWRRFEESLTPRNCSTS